MPPQISMTRTINGQKKSMSTIKQQKTIWIKQACCQHKIEEINL